MPEIWPSDIQALSKFDIDNWQNFFFMPVSHAEFDKYTSSLLTLWLKHADGFPGLR